VHVVNHSLDLLGSQLSVCQHLPELLTTSGSDLWVSDCVRVSVWDGQDKLHSAEISVKISQLFS